MKEILKPLVNLCGRAALACLPVATTIGIMSTTSAAAEITLNDVEPVIEEVYVNAEKRTKAISEVPIGIQVIGSSFIEGGGNLGLSDLEYAIPYLNFGRGGRRTRGEITIRGVGGFSRNIGSDGRVVVYIDEVPLGRSSAYDSNLLDIQQIEVLRGPQGTLFGANAVAGAINIVTADVTENKTATLKQTFGNHGLSIFNTSASTAITEDSALRLEYSHIESDGFIENTYLNSTLQGRNADSFRGKFRHAFSENVSLTLSGDWLEEDTNATNGEAIDDAVTLAGLLEGYTDAPNLYSVSHDAEEYEERKIWGTAATLDWSLSSGASVKSISAIRRSIFEDFSEEDYTSAPISDSTFNESSKQKSQEIRYVSPGDQKIEYVTGLFFSEGENTTDRNARLGADTITTPGTLFVDTYALFIHSDFNINDKFKISLGSRFQKEDKNIHFISDNPSGVAGFVDGELRDKKSFTSALPKIGASYKSNNHLLFSSVSRSSKSGGWNADFVYDLPDTVYDQEYVTNFEIGHKFSSPSSPLRSSLTLYRAKYEDFQIIQLLTQLTNAGEATSEGIELDAEVSISENIRMNYSASYNNAEFDKFENGGRNGDDYSGNDLPFAPELTHFIGLDTDFSLLNKSITWHIDYSFTDDFYTDPSNDDAHLVKNYSLFNTNLTIELNDQFSINTWVKNIADNDRLRFKGNSFLGIPRGYAIPPRSFGVSLEATF